MPMTLEGSCNCGAVRFTVETNTPYPYQRCYCSICRKAGAGGGFAVNMMANHATLEVQGTEHVAILFAEIEENGVRRTGPCGRRFCRHCGTMLWVHDEDWPELMHPFASAIDTDLPEPPERVHLMLDFKPAWVTIDLGPSDQCFGRYPDQSIEDWHRSRGLWID